MDQETRKMLEEISRMLLLVSSKCLTKQQIQAHNTAQAAMIDLEKELKE